MQKSCPPRPLGRGFTLIELLAVTAIIAVLVGLTLPALGRAREQARAVVCAAHLRECFNGVFLYAHDNGGQLPYMGSYYRMQRFAHPKADRSWPAAIAPYIHQAWDIYHCPTDRTPVRVGVTDGRVVRLLPDTPPPERIVTISYRGEERRRVRLSRPRRPADALLLIEGLTEPAAADDHFHGLVKPGQGPPRPGNTPDSQRIARSFRRHNGSAHVVFYTGTVQRIDVDALARVQRRHSSAGLPNLFAPQP